MGVVQWVIRPGILWLLALTAAILYSTVAQWINKHRQERVEVFVRRVDGMLCTWAEHWGEPAEIVRPLLLKAIAKK
jgi:hypothetical protein